jgi:putative addiction module component (TIGR02574 family)
MTVTMKDLGIDRMSAEQKVALALEIWESLGEDRPQPSLSAEQRAELRRRDAELDAGGVAAMSWEQIRTSVESKS